MSDEQIAEFFDIGVTDLAVWAFNSEEFYNAITPSPEERAEYASIVAERRKKMNAIKNRRLAQNPSDRLVNSVRARLWAALKGRSDGRLFGRLGYSLEDLTAHLEARFEPGMTWANYGRWHVDHKKPCALFDLMDAGQFAACWALDNLQPLWAFDNIKKGSSYPVGLA